MVNETPRVKKFTGQTHQNIKKQSIPAIVTTLFMMFNNLVDSGWVAGLGTHPLAALGYITPLLLILIGIGNGMGIGINGIIARCIGINDKKTAENAGLHGMFVGLILSIILPIILILIFKPLIFILGGGDVYNYASQYAYLVFVFSFTYIFMGIGAGILRGAGEGKRSLRAMETTFILNMIFDPIFIYIFNLGLEGAAIATVLSQAIGITIVYTWICLDHDTRYLHIHLKDFKYNHELCKTILNVGVPASLDKIIVQITGLIAVMFIAISSGISTVAAFTVSWRILNIFLVPDLGIATAALTVGGVAYSSKNFDDFKETYNYSIKLSMLISVILAIILYVFAPQMGIFFTDFSATSQLLTPLVRFLHVGCLLLLAYPFCYVTISMFRGVGEGLYSLYLDFFRNIILTITFMIICVFVLNLGDIGVWWGMIIGTFLGSIVNFMVFKKYLTNFFNKLKVTSI